ncbi:MAG: ferredoxin family protein [Planctomycetales bacterium]|nr:ferredoxin family protein [Planctomycetales bacterium]
MAKRISVVLSQGQSQNPVKRALEEEIVTALLLHHGVDVTVIPHLYDLRPDSTGMLALQGVAGDMIVVTWLYERAARWVLDRSGIMGQVGTATLKADPEDEEEVAIADDDKTRVAELREIPARRIYCLELQASSHAQDFVDEILRIAREATTPMIQLGDWLGGSPQPKALARFDSPTNDTALGPSNSTPEQHAAISSEAGPDQASLRRIDDQAARRWYPVIDFSRCTNCMECIDFCLFGVYGVDVADTILVEQPDNCRKGCPACSRVCPENAIIFPQHKSPAIAGAPGAGASLKIDLSRLFGAPDAVEIAARERDEQLELAGRDKVGLSVGIPKRQATPRDESPDELDNLIDQLDGLDL